MNVGRHTYGQNNIKVLWEVPRIAELTIGNFCSIADNVTVFLGGSHRIDWFSTFPFGIKGPFKNKPLTSRDALNLKRNLHVKIGSDVWIAGGVTIMAGVTIGDGSVIARNSHVVKDVAPYEIVGGNPAKHIRYRFDEATIKKLLELKWWDLPDEKVNELIPFLCANDINALIKAIEK